MTPGQHLDLAARTAAVRRWAQHQGRHSEAAAELLIEHGSWLRRRNFLAAATRYYPDEQMLAIRWDAAAAWATGARGSSTELAILEFAAALGGDRFHLGSMGAANARSIARAVATAVGAAHEIGPVR